MLKFRAEIWTGLWAPCLHQPTQLGSSQTYTSVLSASMVLYAANSTEGFLRECICFFVFQIKDATARLTHEFLCFCWGRKGDPAEVSDFRGTTDYLREVKAAVSHIGKAVLPTKTIQGWTKCRIFNPVHSHLFIKKEKLKWMYCYELSQNAFTSLKLTQINTRLISGLPCLWDELRSFGFFDSLYSCYSWPSVSVQLLWIQSIMDRKCLKKCRNFQ